MLLVPPSSWKSWCLHFHKYLLWLKHVRIKKNCNWFDSTFIYHGWKKKWNEPLKKTDSGLKPSQVSCSGYLFKDRRKMYQFPEHMTVKKGWLLYLSELDLNKCENCISRLKVHNCQTSTFPYTSVETIIDMDLKDGSNLRKKKLHYVSPDQRLR